MKRAVFLAVTSLQLLPFACKNDVTPPKPPEFVFRVTVQDGAGMPVPGVAVAARSKLLRWVPPRKTDPGGGARVEATTAFRIDVARRSRMTLAVKDLEGRLLLALLDAYDAMPGRHEIVWSVPAARDAAYRCQMVARDSAGAVLYSDSIVASCRSYEEAANTLGLTATDGIFEIRDKTFFPGLYDLGRMFAISVAGESIGTFAWSDTTVITLANPAAIGTYERVLTEGSNTFTFSWPPIPLAAELHSLRREPLPPAIVASKLDSVPVVPPSRFRLYQNKPNPFD